MTARKKQAIVAAEQSQNSIEKQRKEIAGLNERIAQADSEISPLQKRANKLNNLKNRGGRAGEEARAALADALAQRETLIKDRETRYNILKARGDLLREAEGVLKNG